jgi:hypothetical protein
MGRTLEALKKLGKKCNTSGTEPTGNTTDEVIKSIAENFNITGAKGDTGAAGASVTAITLYTTEGAVTSGVATLSDSSTVEITVTETPAD